MNVYEKLAALTSASCGKSEACRALMGARPYRCCCREFCERALANARAAGERLEPTDNLELPLMGPNGCVAPPHLRPTCSAFSCEYLTGRGANMDEYRRLLRESANV